jgi:hypothetical protein
VKKVVFAWVLVVLALGVSQPRLTVAETDGPSANGSFQVSVVNGETREINFDAKASGDGIATGEITFQDAGPAVADPTTPSKEQPDEAEPRFYVKALCDCLVVEGVEAALSGTVTESSRKDYIGRRVMLVVQDGDSLTPPLRDKLTFGFYSTSVKGWVPTDVELPADQALPPTWIATDAERTDDAGILSQKDERITCHSYPISAYTFIGAKQGKGKIQVTR